MEDVRIYNITDLDPIMSLCGAVIIVLFFRSFAWTQRKEQANSFRSGLTLLDAMVQEVVGMHVSVGQQAKSGGPYSSVSGQISTLRTRFQAAQAECVLGMHRTLRFALFLLSLCLSLALAVVKI